MRTYYWTEERKGRTNQADAQVVGELLEDIGAKAGEDPTSDVLTELIERSKPENAPTHKYFEWDDTVAGNLYRRNQGRRLIRMIAIEVVVNEQTKRKQRFMESIGASSDEKGEEKPPNTSDRRYLTIDQIQADPKLAAQMLRQALNELIIFQGKWKKYREVYNEFAALDAVNREIDQLKFRFNPRPGNIEGSEAEEACVVV